MIILLFETRNEYIIESYSNIEFLKMFESSVGNRAQALPSSQFTNHLPINAYLSSLNDVDSESLQWQKQEHGWEIACTNNTTTKPSPIWTTYIILHETIGPDCFLSNHSTIHWSFNCIERSIETEMVLLKHSWNEQNHDDRWEIITPLMLLPYITE